MIVLFMVIILIFLIVIIKHINYNQEINNIFDNVDNVKKYAEWQTKIAGVTFYNDDGINRQDLIKKLKVGQPIVLVPYMYQNNNAIYVKNIQGDILGNIPQKAVFNLKHRIDTNLIIESYVSSLNSFINEKNEEIFYFKICIKFDANDYDLLMNKNG